jgi:Flp pilus assembly protein TadD
VAAAVLAGIAFAAFAPALRCGFVNFDDPFYVSKTPPVRGGLSWEGTRWAFTTFRVANWHPLTWLSLQLDASVWGTEPWGFHLTSVLLHAANAALLFLALRALTGAFWRSAAVALLFAVHPLRAESVAWVAERKDVLSALFGFLALLVTLPCLLLVLDWWPLKRARALGDWGRLAAEKLPLLALVAATCAVTFVAQADRGAVKDFEGFPLAARLGNAAVSYVVYLWKTVWPAGLAAFYPHPGELPAWQTGGAALLLAALTALGVALRRRAPYLLAGWLWYLGTLVPVIGLVQVGTQAYADRYTYFPQVGLLLAACWGAADLAAGRARVALAAGVVAAAVLAALTREQVGVWHDSSALWNHTLRVAGESPVALTAYAEILEEEGKEGEAAGHYQRALRLEPRSVLAHIGLGRLFFRRQELEQAQREFQEACRLAPTFALARTSLGSVYYLQGRLADAEREDKEAARLAPEFADAYCNLGLVEMKRSDFARAADYFREALRHNPDSADAHSGLGVILFQQRQGEAAVFHLRQAVRCDPGSPERRLNLARVLEARGDRDGARAERGEAERLRARQRQPMILTPAGSR